MNWISVKNKLPAPLIWVDEDGYAIDRDKEGPGHDLLILSDQGAIMTGYYTPEDRHDKSYYYDNDIDYLARAKNRGYEGTFVYNSHCCTESIIATHWMPLSEIPMPDITRDDVDRIMEKLLSCDARTPWEPQE